MCWNAVHGDHLDVLKWAIANGCISDVDARRLALSSYTFAVRDWAKATVAP
jgi:hypothetical protein